MRPLDLRTNFLASFNSALARRAAAAMACCLLLSVCVSGQTRPPKPEAAPLIGLWDGSIQSKAGDVTFGVEFQQDGEQLHATLVNATDRQPFSSAEFKENVLTLRMDYYDGQLTMRYVALGAMEGDYSRQTSKGVVHIPVRLVPHRKPAAAEPWTGPSLTGDWIFTWPEEKGAEKTTLAHIKQEKDAVGGSDVPITGIIEPVSGDTGLLHGTVYNNLEGQTFFHLSRFDGIHALAIDGKLLPDGTLKGQQGGIVALEPFTAERRKDKSTADPNALAETLTKVKDPRQPFRFSGVDQSGKTVDQTDFAGKPLIVDIFGTWCPNCHDEAPVLEKLYQKYRDQGLQIVGLAYEYTDDQQRSLQQIGIYRAKFGLTFPLLLAGTTDQGQIAKTLPQLEGFGAFPTSIFIDRSGHVTAILAGFTGPSTGEKYQQVQQRMDQLAKELVKTSN
ncbi:MAG TPA: TlpA disulfide reductase family protein [Terriglobales bacterium]|jgi:thiol-disulfide isomerase/thioredoxin